MVQCELERVLYPVFIHCYLDLVGSRVAAGEAQKFLTENKHRFLEAGTQSSNRRQQVRDAQATGVSPHLQSDPRQCRHTSSTGPGSNSSACLRSTLLSHSYTMAKHQTGCAILSPRKCLSQMAASHWALQGSLCVMFLSKWLEWLSDLGAAGDPRPVQRVCAGAHQCKSYSSCSPRATLPRQADAVRAAPPHALPAERQAVPDPQHREQESGHPGDLLSPGCASATMPTSAYCRAVLFICAQRRGTSGLLQSAACAAGPSLRTPKQLSSHLGSSLG